MLTDNQIISDPYQNQLLFNMNHDNQSSEPTPVVRIDANSVASNQPIEDYYAHVKFGNGVLGNHLPDRHRLIKSAKSAFTRLDADITQEHSPPTATLQIKSPQRAQLLHGFLDFRIH
ncbi:hypothetical protein BSLG_005897 [Batrachochytrium salamandrivorans]|nr:hypothetical protein BSLG_005897 [Batrachochytrium salamandrivorans]